MTEPAGLQASCKTMTESSHAGSLVDQVPAVKSTNCTTCRNWRLKGAPLLRHGFGQCLSKVGANTTPEHSCRQHKEAPEATVEARRVWLSKSAPGEKEPAPLFTPPPSPQRTGER